MVRKKPASAHRQGCAGRLRSELTPDSPLAVAASLLANLAVLVGVPLFFYQQRIETQRARTITTLEFVDRFQAPEFAGMRFTLLKPWFGYEAQLAALSRSGVQPWVLEKWVLDVVDAAADDPGESDLRPAIVALVDFFDSIVLCIETHACDESLALSYFRHFAREFHCLYRPVIARYRDQLSLEDFGSSVERIAGGSNACTGS